MLELRDLSLDFQSPEGERLNALSGVSLALQPRKITALIGASGAGKSLVANALMGHLPRNAQLRGQIALEGRKPRSGEIALAPQGIEALDPLATIEAQIRRFAKLGGQICDPCLLIGRLGLGAEVLSQYPHQLSGGMAKRVLLATALATGARYVLVDEPTHGLDPQSAKKIIRLLDDLASGGLAILLISHDLPLILPIAHEVVFLSQGRQLEKATPPDCMRQTLRSPQARALIRANFPAAPNGEAFAC